MLECIADALIVLSGDCRLRHHGTGVCGSQGMGCCGGGLGQSADRLRSEFCVFWETRVFDGGV